MNTAHLPALFTQKHNPPLTPASQARQNFEPALLRVLFAVGLAVMPLFTAWYQWAQRRERDALYAALQLAWWLAEGGPILSSLQSAFRGRAQCPATKAVRPRRLRRTPLAGRPA
jgi:hypothetical protein